MDTVFVSLRTSCLHLYLHISYCVYRVLTLQRQGGGLHAQQKPRQGGVQQRLPEHGCATIRMPRLPCIGGTSMEAGFWVTYYTRRVTCQPSYQTLVLCCHTMGTGDLSGAPF